MPAIHKNIRLLRQIKGMTQKEAADAMGVSRQTMSGYESGRIQPDLESLKGLAEIYHADIQDVLYGESKLQRRIKFVRLSMLLLTVLLLLGLFVRSGLLWTAGNVFSVSPGATVTDSSHQVFIIHSALRDASASITRVVVPVYNLGCMMVLYPMATLNPRMSPGRQLGLFLAFITACFGAVVPWSVFDDFYSCWNYFIPIWRTLPVSWLVFQGTLIADYCRKRKTRTAKCKKDKE